MENVKSILNKIFIVIKNILIVIGAIFGAFFILGKFGSKNVYEKAIKEKIKENNNKIEEKEKHINELEKEDKLLEDKNKELTSKLNDIKEDMEEKEKLFYKQREEIEKNKNNTNANIDYINDKYK